MKEFKGFLSRVMHIGSKKYLAQEKTFSVKIFAENRHNVFGKNICRK